MILKAAALRPASRAGLTRLRAWWQGLPSRERLGVTATLVVLLVAVLWWVALRPAWTTLRTAPAQRQALDLQLQRMQQLQAQVTAMRAATQPLPPLGREEAQRALETEIRQHFGEAARLVAGPQGVTLTLNGVSGQALAQWLAQARIEARTLPTEAHLERQASGTWKGQMTLALPGSPASPPARTP
ncbi:MAG: putative ral secretion pathway protein component of type secretion system [Pseudomonadota bacterium]